MGFFVDKTAHIGTLHIPLYSESARQQPCLRQTFPNPVQRFRVAQRIPVVGFAGAVDQPGHREFHLFATAGVGNVGHFHDVFGYVPGAGDVDDGGPYLVGMLPRFIDRL